MKLNKNNYAIVAGEIAALEELARLGEISDSERSELRHLKKQMAKMTKTRNYRSEVPSERKRSDEERAFDRYLRGGSYDGSKVVEFRDGTGMSTLPYDQPMAAGQPTSGGGYLVPSSFWRQLSIATKAYSGLAQDMHVITTPTGAPAPWPVINPTSVLAQVMGGELTQLTPSDAYVFGQGMLQSWTLATQPILVSVQLVNDSAFDVDAFLNDRVSEQIGRKVAVLAYSGTGSGQPLGINTALAAAPAWSAGNSGGQYNLTAATTVKLFSGSTTELTGNVIAPQTAVALAAALDPSYYPGAKFYMNATMAWNMRQVVDANGRPIISFMNGLVADDVQSGAVGNHNTNSPVAQILGFPVVIDNAIVSLTANTCSGVIFGNLDKAMVMREVAGGTTILRLTERYADYLAIGYIGYMRMDLRSNDLRAAVQTTAQAS